MCESFLLASINNLPGCKGRVRAGFLKSIKSYQALRFVKAVSGEMRCASVQTHDGRMPLALCAWQTLIQSHWRRVVAVQNLQLEYVVSTTHTRTHTQTHPHPPSARLSIGGRVRFAAC